MHSYFVKKCFPTTTEQQINSGTGSAWVNCRKIAKSLTDGASETPINRRARNREQLPQVADRIFSGSVHAEKLFLLFVRKLGALAPQFPLRARDRHSFSRTQSNKVGLKFSKGRQDVEEHLAHWITWIVAVLTEGKRNATSGELIGNGPRVWNGAGEPVQLRNDQRIAMSNGGKRLIETGPGTVCAGQSVIEVNSVGSDT